MVNELDLVALCHALDLPVHSDGDYGLGYFAGIYRLVLKRVLLVYRPRNLYDLAELLIVKPNDKLIRDLDLPRGDAYDAAVVDIARAMCKLRPDLIEQ